MTSCTAAHCSWQPSRQCAAHERVTTLPSAPSSPEVSVTSEQSTPRQPGGWTDWDRFAAAEYNRLLLEEDEQQGEGGFDENELEHDDEDEPLFQVDAEGLGDGGEADRMM